MNINNKLDSIRAFEAFNRLSRYDDSAMSDYEKLQKATSFWFNEVAEENTHGSSILCKGELQADSGSSGFYPPDGIIDKIKKFDQNDVVNYGPCLINDDKILKKIEKYCVDFKITKKEIKLGVNPTNDESKDDLLYVLPGPGTTLLYNLAVKIILKNANDFFIVPTPTYGLFIPPIFENNGIALSFPLNKENNFKINSKDLKSFVINKEREIYNQYITCIKELYYSHSFQPNLLDQLFLDGFKKSHSSSIIKSKNKIIKSINEKIKETTKYKNLPAAHREKLLFPLINRIRGFLNINPHTPTGTTLNQKEISKIVKVLSRYGIKVIDDLTHLNINYTNQKIGTFLRSKSIKKIDPNVVTLISFSKDFGLANIKAGFALAGQKMANKMMSSLLSSYGSVSLLTKKTIETILSLDKNELTCYLTENNKKYLERRNLIISIVDGFESINDRKIASSVNEVLENIFKKLRDKKKSNLKSYQDKLKEGIKDLKVVYPSQAGLFILLDFSAFKGKYFGNVEIKSSMDIRNALYFHSNLNTIPSEMLFHFDPHDLYLRFSLSLNELEICEAMLRIKDILNEMADPPSKAVCTSSSSSSAASLSHNMTGIALEDEGEETLSLKRKENSESSEETKKDENVEDKKRRKKGVEQQSTSSYSSSDCLHSSSLGSEADRLAGALPLRSAEPVQEKTLYQPPIISNPIEFMGENLIKYTRYKYESYENIIKNISDRLKTNYDLFLVDDGEYRLFDINVFSENYWVNQDREQWTLIFTVFVKHA